MRFNVSQLIGESGGSIRRYSIDEYVPFSDTGEIVQVRGGLQLVKTDKGVWVTAQMDTEVDFECSRCLDEYSQSVHIEIDEEAVPKLDAVIGVKVLDEYELHESLVIDENNVLNLIESTRQYVVLGLPMKPVCSEDCQGLCTMCGVNRNRESCNCDRVERDTKWGVLLDMIPSTQTVEMNKN